MSITKSYNKHTNIYYAYETTYEWDESKQKKVQKKKCIGQFDPVTGEVIPNGKVGRPSRTVQLSGTKNQDNSERTEEQDIDRKRLLLKLSKMESALSTLSKEIQEMKDDIGGSISDS